MPRRRLSQGRRQSYCTARRHCQQRLAHLQRRRRTEDGMKISILLPTRDRLEYLRDAVTSVLREGAEDWEVIISDNQSFADVAGFVDSIGDERVRYFRSERLLPVSDNWNNALRQST